ncbi:MocR-like pyridoxine biosynthesis transcription factor PdxR [Actinomadura livida]|uniref:GntR family transcriptional regulator/MocR family aminotransferase n=1 Tax=Actinomadura livida TaxID=79909 RepID=A0A7W7IHQ5_9ACTN|nr:MULTISPECIES: PLP-dependent aminotransferase family protein [Actinomadura]MBB4777311.1 GntR family transcriptional regulator/MocR family aminotransferase [Actinomadura catellatispora]GGU20154.1 GntR family transcriptional regulator [Actinomadura livida]
MSVDLPLTVDRDAGLPLSAQLVAQLRAAMGEGRLAAGERLPASRALAGVLGVSRTVVTEAYEQLYAEGWLEGRHGSGTYVTEGVAAPPALDPGPVTIETVFRTAGPGEIDLRPGAAWVGALDTPAWRRAWRIASGMPPEQRQDPHGLPGLRVALADYIRRSRGVACRADGLLVTRGATNGLDLLAATVLRPGDRVGVEEPGYRRARAVLAGRGAELVPCPVDEHGLIVDGLPDGLRLVYTTPSHQFPMGGVLPVPRRQALLAWARRNGALVAEDDYDGEFRYDVAPLPALYGLDPDVVVYLGTTAKILTADLAVGWLVARPGLVGRIARCRRELNDRTAVVPQDALRLLLERGDVDRHVRRMRAEYARRRDVVVQALDGLPLRGDTAGLHLVADVPAEVAGRIVRAARERGVLVETLDRHHAGAPRASGLVIGYGSAASRAQLRKGCEIVRRLARAG